MKFEELNLPQNILKIIQQQGFTETTLIQEKSSPLIQQGKDLVGQSGTGSGKTLAFGIPLIEKIQPRKRIQALLLTPTRELCVQVADVLQTIGKPLSLRVASVFGGVGFEPQVRALQSSEIVVGTPGRILDHIDHNTLNLENVHFLVLDEADKMFEMGFKEDVERIISYVPKNRQTLMFSATISEAVHDIMKKNLRNPLMVQAMIRVDKNLLHQSYYEIPLKDKFSLLVHLLKNATPGLAIVFCATRHEVDIVSWNLRKNSIDALAIHGGLSQNKRLHALDALKKNNVGVLVATDVAARGLDIKNISHIYNYDVPKTSDEYIHRIGRTARAGEEGDAITFLTERDHENFRNVLRDRTLKITAAQSPQFERVHFLRRTPEPVRDSHSFGNYHRSQEQYSQRPSSSRFSSRPGTFAERRKFFGNRKRN